MADKNELLIFVFAALLLGSYFLHTKTELHLLASFEINPKLFQNQLYATQVKI